MCNEAVSSEIEIAAISIAAISIAAISIAAQTALRKRRSQ